MAVETESARRIKEVRYLAMVVPNMGEESIRSPMMRACVVLFHGHLEGFVKNSSRTFLQFMEDENIISLRLSGKWLKSERFSGGVLPNVAHFLGMDDGLFQTKVPYLEQMKKWRDQVAHGKDIDKNVQFKRADIHKMADVVSDVIESFGDSILDLVDEVQRK